MAISSINSLTKLRLTGLASGMDTDAIIKSMMQIEQLKINRQYRAKTTLQWKQEALGGVKSDLTSFFQDFISTLSSKSMMKEGAYNAYKAEVTGKNASAVTVSSTVHATPGKVTIDRVEQLAKAANVSSESTHKASVSSASGSFKTKDDTKILGFDTELGELEGFTFDGENKVSFHINGNKFTFSSDDSLEDVADTINKANIGVKMDFAFTNSGDAVTLKATNPGGTITIADGDGDPNVVGSVFGIATGEYKSTLKGVSATGNGLGTYSSQTMLKDLALAEPLKFENGEVSFKINGKTFAFKETDTLGKMMSTINSSDVGVMMSYSELTDSFTLKSKETGANSAMSIQNLKGNAFGVNSAFGIEDKTYTNGEDAIVHINGIKVTRSTNNFSIDGISYMLNRVTKAGDDPIEINISRDVEDAVTKIKEFVDGYNTLIKKLEGLLKDRKSTDEVGYVPLTDDEKAEMTDKQIEEWESIAKKGILRSNAGIQGLVSSLRGALFETVNSVGMSPSDIGLSTGNYFLGNGGQISLDENKLRDALGTNPEAVMSVFTDMSAVSYTEDKKRAYSESGLMKRIEMIFDTYNKGAGEIALDGIEYSLKQVTDKITTMQQKMLDKEEKLYKKYAALETAMSKMQSQSDWLSGMLGSTNSK